MPIEESYQPRPIISFSEIKISDNHSTAMTLYCRTRQLFATLTPNEKSTPYLEGEDKILEFLNGKILPVNYDYVKKCLGAYKMIENLVDSHFDEISKVVESNLNPEYLPMILTFRKSNNFIGIDLSEVVSIECNTVLDIRFNMSSGESIVVSANKDDTLLKQIFDAWSFWRVFAKTGYQKDDETR